MVSIKTIVSIGLVGTALVSVLLFRTQLVQGALDLGTTAGELITSPFIGLAQSFTAFEQTIGAALNPLAAGKCPATPLSTPLSPPAPGGTQYCPTKAQPNCATQALIRSLCVAKLCCTYFKNYNAGLTNVQPVQEALSASAYAALGGSAIFAANVALGANPCTGEFDLRKCPNSTTGAYAMFKVSGSPVAVPLTAAELAYDKSKGYSVVQV